MHWSMKATGSCGLSLRCAYTYTVQGSFDQQPPTILAAVEVFSMESTAVSGKKRPGRKPLCLDSIQRKKRRADRAKQHFDRGRIRIGANQHSRWALVKSSLCLKNDGEVAKMLLDRYERWHPGYKQKLEAYTPPPITNSKAWLFELSIFVVHKRWRLRISRILKPRLFVLTILLSSYLSNSNYLSPCFNNHNSSLPLDISPSSLSAVTWRWHARLRKSNACSPILSTPICHELWLGHDYCLDM